MKILLLYGGVMPGKEHTSINSFETNYPPLGLLYMYGLLKENGENINFYNISDYIPKETEELIKKESPDIVGISCHCLNRFVVLKLCEIIKNLSTLMQKDIITVVGGPEPTFIYKTLLEASSYIDFIIVGEGERSFSELIQAIKNKEDPKKVKGVAFKQGENVIYTGKVELIKNLSSMPSYIKYYYNPYSLNFSLLTTRGCPGNCLFCTTPLMWGQKLRERSVESVLDEIGEFYKRKITEISFMDDTFTVNKQRVIKICKGIIERQYKIRWTCNARVNFVDDERLYWMRKAGCYRISYGIESGSTMILKVLQKYFSLDQVRNAAKLTRKYGFHMRFYLIVGSPGETEETIQESINIIKECKPHEIVVSPFVIYPGTQIFNKAKEEGYLTEEQWFQKQVLFHYTKEHNFDTIKGFKQKIETFFNSNKDSYQYSFDDIQEMIKTFPEIPEIYHLLAAFYYNNKKYDQSIVTLKKAQEIGLTEYFLYYSLALNYINIGELKKAEESFLKSTKYNPHNPIIYNALGKFYTNHRRNYLRSLECFERSLKMIPFDSKIKQYVKQLKKHMGIKNNDLNYDFSVTY